MLIYCCTEFVNEVLIAFFTLDYLISDVRCAKKINANDFATKVYSKVPAYYSIEYFTKRNF